MPWLLPASISILVAMSVLTLTFGYLYRVYRERHLLLWSAATLFWCARYVMLILQLTWGKHLLLDIGYYLTTVIGACLMFYGVQAFIRGGFNLRWLYLFGAGAVWAILAPMTALTSPTISTAVLFLMGFSQIAMGWSLLSSGPKPRPLSVSITGFLFIIWGIHQFDYPILRFVTWFAPIGYTIGGTFALSTSVGLILVYFEKMQRQLKESEEELRYRTDELETILDAIPAVVWVAHDPEASVIKGNRAASLMMGVAKGLNMSLGASDAERPRDIRVFKDGRELIPEEMPVQVAARGQELNGFEFDLVFADGREKRMLGNATPLFDREGKVRGSVAAFVDITDRKLGEELLREYKNFLENMDDMVAVVDENYRYVVANQAFLEKRAMSAPVVGRHVADLLGEEEFDRFLKPMLDRCFAGETVVFEMAQEYPLVGERHLLVKYFPVAAPGKRKRVAAIIRDVTDAKRLEGERITLEKQLFQAQKMDALGTLAGGIAHDFNNILAAVMGYAELSLNQKGVDETLKGNLSEILTASMRAKELVGQILAFSRKSGDQPSPMNPQPVVQEALKLLRATVPTTITIESEVVSGPLPVLATPGQLHQLLMNLATNAVQAVGDGPGRIEVSLGRETINEKEAKALDVKPGEHFFLKVSDTGPGIPPDVLPRIFDPFFTTKPLGKGTGLGLSVAHGIIRSLGGAIAVESSLGKGASFKVVMPLLHETAIAETASAKKGGRVSFRKSVLVVDDEPALAVLIKRIFESLGCTAHSHTDPTAALDDFQANLGGYDLIITDQTMPGLTGAELLKRARALRPDVDVIVCTGHSESLDEAKAAELGASAFLRKPITLSDLIKTLTNLGW